ncbi:CBS domain [Ostreococcus tauri]|uniref:CBS domain n=1 Tax=Ostreococcus tauri TaxID=70448 RepID=Q018T1_OSTTA|nr:CBS domain [Ostreococcus tauri]CAL54094.1 CBS domain [Ostreococcus tauri]|eukprot:XP_003079436.1 CBS domain [Ostreococcus tauri]
MFTASVKSSDIVPKSSTNHSRHARVARGARASAQHRPTGGESSMDRLVLSDPDPFSAKAQDYMSQPVAFLRPEMELKDPVVKKFLKRYTGVPVCDASRHVIGIVSHKDLALATVANDRKLNGSKVKHVMKSPVHCVTGHTSIAACWAEMLKWKIWRLPVVTADKKQLVGIVSRSDVLTPLMNTAEDARTLGEMLEREEHLSQLEKMEVEFDEDSAMTAEFFTDAADAALDDDFSDDQDDQDNDVYPEDDQFWYPTTMTRTR